MPDIDKYTAKCLQRDKLTDGISWDINLNLRIIIKQIQIASAKFADTALFPECNLSAYPGVEFLKQSICKRSLLIHPDITDKLL